MGKKAKSEEDGGLEGLVSGILQDAATLFGQQVDLLRGEVRQEVHRAAGAAVSMAAGGGFVAAGGLLTGMALAHFLHRSTGLPLWCCYGAAAGACGAAGAALVRAGEKKLADVRVLPPPQTAASLEENLTWLKEQVSPAVP